ncbi:MULTISPECIES: PEGA domain-containing protein [unclassified Methanoregula]|uniref:PEGA domain-containing protein n=1 Tax=unclassified Methanoregula TaxID=2649730 RepID=UPI0009CA19D6|nr:MULTISPECIES: PEGA domain-containing protein [unclassified Methanoregula]OPX63115.1 MAG: PEGA domain protein [Methanoregula sp. PtaB.Bin085]OPY36328.1 MAG: PEGA domain protein [Methanoregula sp. PtaU1.Bin006]
MKYGTAFLLVLFFCIACVCAAPPTQSCAQSYIGSCGNMPNGRVMVYLNLPVSDDVIFLRGTEQLHPTIRSLPDPYSIYTGYELGFSPGTYTITVRRPGYNDAAFSTEVCDCKYSFVNVVMVPAVTTTVTTAKSGYAVKPAVSGYSVITAATTAPVTTTPKYAVNVAGTIDVATLAPKTTTASVSQGSGSQTGGTGSQGTGTGSTGSGQTGSTSVSSQAGSGSGSQQAGSGTAGNIAPAATGILSVTTTPAGAYVFIDGAQRGVTPATISGLAPGDHTLLLKMDGYKDLTTTITIIAGQTQPFSSGLVPVSGTPVATKKSPGFAFIAALASLGAVLCLREMRSQ